MEVWACLDGHFNLQLLCRCFCVIENWVIIYLQFEILVIGVYVKVFSAWNIFYFRNHWKFFRTSNILSNIPYDFSSIISMKSKTLLKRWSRTLVWPFEILLESEASFSSSSRNWSWEYGTEKSFIISGAFLTVHFAHS